MQFRSIFGLLLCVSFCLSDVPITVVTRIGRIKGNLDYISVDGEQKLISKYFGIPYAESTAGDNRFKKPVPKAPFKGIFDARNPQMACLQQTYFMTDLLKQKYGVPGFSEDCLTLNIYSPYRLRAAYLMPVMVWIHGGGFSQGTASMYKPEALALYGNVVVVTINYRVGMFGFLRDSDGKVIGNQGLWDQHIALKWINENIGSFHGNGNEVTIFGQSAGGALALIQALYPGNKGLFQRVIAESGSPLAPWAVKDIGTSEKYIQELGCTPNRNNTLVCLQKIAPKKLQYLDANLGPVVDGEFLIASPDEILIDQSLKTAHAREMFASVDILLGFNDKDGVLYYNTWAALLGHTSLDFNVTRNEFNDKIVPEFVRVKFSSEYTNATRNALEELLTFFYTDWFHPHDEQVIQDTLVAMSNDPMFFFPAIGVARAHTDLLRGKTYFYEFAVESDKHPLPVPSWLTGSYHADEIPYVFGFPLLINATLFGEELSNFTMEEQQISKAMMTFWSNFAKSGNPNVQLKSKLYWPEFNMTSQKYFQISNQISGMSVMDMDQFHPRRMAFWTNLVPRIIELVQNNKSQSDAIQPVSSSVLVSSSVPIK